MQPRRQHKPHSLDPSLTINVESAQDWKRLSGAHLSSGAPISFLRASSGVISTPQTGQTFGCPTATFGPPAIPTTVEEESPADERRQRRYTASEAALASLVKQSYTEPSPEELQIRVLKSAATLLTSRAEEARERSVKLKELVAARDAGSAEYELIRRERWMEEKRRAAAELDTKVLNERLDILTHPHANNTHPDSPSDNDERRRQNLAKFLASSTRLAPIRSHAPPSRDIRRLTLGDMSSSLQPSSLISLDSSPSKYHSRSMSEDNYAVDPPAELPRSRSNNRDSVAMTFGIGASFSLDTVQEDGLGDDSLDAVQEVEVDDNGRFLYASSTSPSPSPVNSPASFTFGPITICSVDSTVVSTPVDNDGSDDKTSDNWSIHGRATIYHQQYRPTPDIAAEMSQVELPAYVDDLIDDLNRLPSRISPRLRIETSPSFQYRQRQSSMTTDASDWELLTPVTDSPTIESESPLTLEHNPPIQQRHRPDLSLVHVFPVMTISSPPESPTIFKQPSIVQLRALTQYRPNYSISGLPEVDQPSMAPLTRPVKQRSLSLNIFSSLSRSRPLSPLPDTPESPSPVPSRPATPYGLRPSTPFGLAASRPVTPIGLSSPSRSSTPFGLDTIKTRKMLPLGMFTRRSRASRDEDFEEHVDRTSSPTPTLPTQRDTLTSKVLRRFRLSTTARA